MNAHSIEFDNHAHNGDVVQGQVIESIDQSTLAMDLNSSHGYFIFLNNWGFMRLSNIDEIHFLV